MKLPKPAVGRIVHFLAPRTSRPLMAAIILQVHNTHPDQAAEGLVDLNVFHPNSGGGHLVPGVKFSRKEKDGCWWWPQNAGEIDVKDDGIAYEKAEEPVQPQHKGAQVYKEGARK